MLSPARGLAVAAMAVTAALYMGREKDEIERGALVLVDSWLRMSRKEIAAAINNLRVVPSQRHRIGAALKLLGVFRGE